MAGHINKGQCRGTLHLIIIQGQVGEADVNGQAALFFFRQSISIGAGEGFDERGLTMIDMACSGNDHEQTTDR